MDGDTNDILSEPLYTGQLFNLGEYPESQCERVRSLARHGQSQDRQLFCEMLELCQLEGDNYCWYEQARWIKYEETVEGSKQRWSKPHIPLITLKSLLQLKNCLKRGAMLLDVQVRTFPQLIDKIITRWEDEHMINLQDSDYLKALLLCNKEHLLSSGGLKAKFANFLHPKSYTERKPSDLDSTHTQSGGEDTETETDLTEADKIHPNVELTKKLSEHAEIALILIGRAERIENPTCAFVRLQEAKAFSNCAEVTKPLRFLFVLLIQEESDYGNDLEMVGRALAAALTDNIFMHVAYEAQDLYDLYYGVDEFMSSMAIIPPGKWPRGARLEPSEAVVVSQSHPQTARQQSERFARRRMTKRKSQDFGFNGLQYTGRIFGGLIDDIKRKIPFYGSDFLDSFSSANAISQCLAASLFLFFANLTNIITFGGVMGKFLDKEMGVMECIVSGFVSGIIFGLFSGQPMNILSATGPVLIFETLFYKFCNDYGWAFLPARFWLGFWSSVQILILVAFDASFLVAYITRFTEECFATLISVIFIVESLQSMIKLAANAPVTPDPAVVINDFCRCVVNFNDTETNETYYNVWTNVTSQEVCDTYNGTLVGQMCTFHPDVFMFELLLFIGTFTLAYMLRSFRTSRFFPSKFRSVVSDFSVFISICSMTLVAYFVGLRVETLEVPKKFQPTKDRSWIVDVGNLEYGWIVIACFLPALLLTVLIVMDQQITAVIVNRKDNKLKKGFGYHLDLLWVGFLILICSLFGLPYFVAATILSITHVKSLHMESECNAPGEIPLFLGVREQRVTTIIAHILIGLSIFLRDVQTLVPTAVLLGIFLYMGVSCLADQQFVRRILLFITPVKYQPDYGFLRVVPLKRVFLFTGVQLISFVLLCIVKYSKQISMLFPILLIVLVGVRKCLDRFFSQEELAALDDVLPLRRFLRKRNASISSVPNKSIRLLS